MATARSATRPTPASIPNAPELRLHPVAGESPLVRSFQIAMMIIVTAQQDLGGVVVTAEIIEKLNALFRSTDPEGARVEWSDCTFQVEARCRAFRVQLMAPHAALEARLANLAERLSGVHYRRALASRTLPIMITSYDPERLLFQMVVLPSGN